MKLEELERESSATRRTRVCEPCKGEGLLHSPHRFVMIDNDGVARYAIVTEDGRVILEEEF